MHERAISLWEHAHLTMPGSPGVSEREPGVIYVQCQYCFLPPMPAGKIGPHQRQKHKIASTNPASVRRRIARERARGVSRSPSVRPPPPPVPNVTPHRALRQHKPLDPGDIERIRKEMLYYVQADLAPRFDATPTAIVEAIKLICDRNLEPPPAKKRSVPLGDIP
jgi:hypothetical protein